MKQKITLVLKKTLKVILWVIGIIILLFVITALIIQIPSVQTKLVHKVTAYLQQKTHSDIEIKSVGIVFPKSIAIDGIMLKDLKKDTLLYIGETRVDLAMLDLIKSNINLKSVAITDLTGRVYNTENDSVFNYNFLIAAFVDSTKKEITEPEKKKTTNFNIEDIDLKNIRVIYDDKYHGLYANASLKELNLEIDELNIDQQFYKIDNFNLEGFRGDVIIKKISNGTSSEPSPRLPKVIIENFSIKTTHFNYQNLADQQHITAAITDLSLENTNLDLNKQGISIDELLLSKSMISMTATEPPPLPTDTILKPATEENKWNVTVKTIKLNDNQLAYNLKNKPVIPNAFDPAHINYKHLSLNANSIFYSSDRIDATVTKLAATDSINFELVDLKTNFHMDKQSISAKNLVIKTANSSINTTAQLNFSSLELLKDSLKNLVVAVKLNKTKIHTKDVLYFSPQLIKQPFFKDASNYIVISGNITGAIKNIKAENIHIQTGDKTQLEANFKIVGLPEANNAYYDVAIKRLATTNKDIIALLGTEVIPKSITLPGSIAIHGNFIGKIKAFKSKVVLNTDFGNANLLATIDNNENFNATVEVDAFDVGSLLNDKKMFGPITLTSKVNGQGLTKKTITATVVADVPTFYLNQYTYHQLAIDGAITGEQFEGKVTLNDSNAAFDFDGLVNVSDEDKKYKFDLNLKGADLQKLHWVDKDFRIGLNAVVDLKGKDVNTINGTAGITRIIISHKGKQYVLDSLLFANINEKRKSDLSIRSALVGITYNGTFAPADLAKELKKYVNNYFPVITDTNKLEASLDQNFNFEIQLHNHPIIAEVFLPELKEFSPGPIVGSFDSKANKLEINAAMDKIVYADMTVRAMVLTVNSTQKELNYNLSCAELSNAQAKLDNFSISGKLAEQVAYVSVSSIDEKKKKKLAINAQITPVDKDYKIAIEPNSLYIMDEKWQLPDNNEVIVGKNGFIIRHLNLQNNKSEILLASVNNKFNDDIKATIKNFELANISRIIEKDSNLLQGQINGDLLLKRIDTTYGIVSNININDFRFREVPIGNITLKAENATPTKFNVDMALTGNENDLNVKGYFMPNEAKDALNMAIKINALSAKTLEAFSMGQLREVEGKLHGNFAITGTTKEPEIKGSITFDNLFLNPIALNSRLEFRNETITIDKDGVYLKSFTILDKNNKPATINGSVKMKQLKDFNFDVVVTTNDFMLLNTTSKDNKLYNGRMIVDSKIKINGTPSLPVINSSIKLKQGSTVTFAVPESKLTTDKGENIVVFMGEDKLHPIITRDEKGQSKSELKSLDITSTVQIGKNATLKLLVDPTSGDSLVMKGDAALSFSLDPSGKMSLTGAYNLNDGSYLVSLENVIKKKFEIQSGSTIVWNGDPLDAEINLTAVYSVRTSPMDLVADQMGGLSDVDKGGYRQRYPFLVYLKLKGAILTPEISFEIQLPPEEKGILGGAVNAKLIQLNEDPSALNKQVFALLVLNRFIQENPLESEGSTTASTAARASAGKFLSSQLNQLSSKLVSGVELNFDIQSYDDYSSGKAEGRTEVDIGVKKQLFNDRLSVQVGGTVDVEGERAKQNSASDLTGDVTIEYKITPNGRYRAKGFRHNQYAGAIEGQLYETGVGLMYVRDFNRWEQLFKRRKKRTTENLPYGPQNNK